MKPASIKGDPAARHEVMGMRMMRQELASGMENSDHLGLGTEMLRGGAEETYGLGCCFEQNIADHRLILQRDGGHGRRHGEDDTETGSRSVWRSPSH